MSLSTFDAFKQLSAKEDVIEIKGETLARIQKLLVEMLDDFDAVCKEIGVEYTLGGGSCLGAVRNKGFIPWDDDLDLNMSRRDFEVFEGAFSRTLGDRYWLHVPGKTPGYDLCFPRLRLKGTILRTRDDFDNDECGVYIDIFLIENAPSTRVARAFHGAISMSLGFGYSCRRFFKYRTLYASLSKDNKKMGAVFKFKTLIGRLLSFASMDWWCRAWDRWNGLARSTSTCYVTIPVGRKHYFGELYIRDQYFPPSFGEFSGRQVPLPANPSIYLRNLYGDDYLCPPAESDRERHLVYECKLTDVWN